jgi:hypothetical protein
MLVQQPSQINVVIAFDIRHGRVYHFEVRLKTTLLCGKTLGRDLATGPALSLDV